MISIVIIVKNDPGIRDTLDLLQSIDKPDRLEIVVVASGIKASDNICLQYPQVRWVYYENSTAKRVTIPEQRNLGIKHAKGNIVAFIDANCRPERSWLTNLTYPIFKEDEAITAGSVSSIGGSTRHDQRSEENNMQGRQYIDGCPTINMAFRKDIVESIGYFDESFLYGSDLDFTWRAIEHGYRVRYVKDARISHNWGEVKHEIRRSYLYGRGRVKLYRKHFIKRIGRHTAKELLPLAYPLYILLLPLTIWFPFYPAVILLAIVKNYRNRPLASTFNHLVYAVGMFREAGNMLKGRLRAEVS